MKLLLENWRRYLTEAIDDNSLVATIEKYHEEGQSPIDWRRDDLSDIKDPIELRILQAIYLFTSGEWKKVIDPNSKSEATEIVKKLGTLPNPFPERPIYRGIGRQLEQVKNMTVGQEFDLGVGSSWTNSERIAINFTLSNLKGSKRNNDTAVLFEIRHPKRGSPVYNISKTPDEKEVILGGKIKIIEKSKIIGGDAASKVVGHKGHLKNKWIPEPTFPDMDDKYFCIILCETT